jgi:prepilin-type N-terminal cleavage/methylation domain-containing protein
MFNSRKRRSGFTLPEVLVTVAIVAVLAAAVVPTVVNQMGKGEGASVAADINSLTQAVTQFITDTRRYPRALEDLNTQIDDTDLDLLSTAYGTRAEAAWGGPYFAANGGVALTNFTFSGFGLVAANALVAPDATPSTGNGGYITLSITSTHSIASIIAADVAIDGGDGVFVTDCPTASTGSTTGRLRWTETDAGSTCTISAITFRLVPTGG